MTAFKAAVGLMVRKRASCRWTARPHMKEREGNRTPVPCFLAASARYGIPPGVFDATLWLREDSNPHPCPCMLCPVELRSRPEHAGATTWVIRLLPARHTHETHVGHAGFRRGVAHSPPSGAAENRTRVWSAYRLCLPSRAYPTLDAHPRTGAFGEPARLVDDVHVLAGRIHRPTVRPVRSLVVRLRPFDRQMAESGLTRRA